MEALEIVEKLVSVCALIIKLKHQIKANREQASRLMRRVELLQQSLDMFKGRKVSSQLNANFIALLKLLHEVSDFIKEYSEETSWFVRIYKTGSASESFKDFTERLHLSVSQMNLSVNIERFTYQADDRMAASSDADLIKANMSAIIDLHQIARYQFAALKQQGGEIEGVLKCGLYQLGDQVGAVKDVVVRENRRLHAAVTDFRKELAKRDKRLEHKLDDLQDGMGGLVEVVGGLKVQVGGNQDAIMLQLLSMRRHMENLENPDSADKPLLDPQLQIPLEEISLELEPFAQGGFGVLYRGVYVEETVAVKILPKFEPGDAEQFYREVKIMSRLRSKYITQFYGASVVDGQAAIVMSYKEGRDLNVYLKGKSELDWQQKDQLMQDIVSGLCYLHSQNITHRDLKSANILVDDQGHTTISDFGLALASQISVQTIQKRSAAWSWMAPEYWQGNLDFKSDIYSLGVILLEIVSQQPPIEIPNTGITSSLNQTRIASIPNECPSELGALIIDCLEMDAGLRPSAKDILARLKEVEYRPKSPPPEILYKMGAEAQKRGNMENAYALFQRSDQKGYFKASTSLGLFRLQGLGVVPVDKLAALTLFKIGAKAGHVRAMVNLANMYGYGDGVELDYKQAYKYAKKAWDAGDSASEELYKKFKTRYEAMQSQQPHYVAYSQATE